MRTEEFFEQVRTGKISDLDLYSKVQQLTDNFDEKKLNLLCSDFDNYIFREFKEWRESIDIEKPIQKWRKDKVKFHGENDKLIRDQLLYVRNYFEGGNIPNKLIPKKKSSDILNEILQSDSISNKQRYLFTEIFRGWFYFKKENLQLNRLKELLVELKIKHTSAEYKFDDKPDELQDNSQNINYKSYESVEYFFESVCNSQLHRIEIHNKIQELTDNYDEEKLNLLCSDFDEYLGILYDQWLSTFTEDDIQKKIEAVKESDKKLPLKTDEGYDPVFVNDHFKQSANIQTSYVDPPPIVDLLIEEINSIKDNPIDIDRLFGGFFFSKYANDSILTLRNSLVKLKEKHTSAEYKFEDSPDEIQDKSNYINWLKSDDSREQLIESLKKHNLIEDRKTKTIIKDHFEPIRDQNREPEPIKWTYPYQNLLVYLFRNLYEKPYFINPESKEWELVSKHFIKKDGTHFKTPSLTQEAYNQNKNGILPANGTDTIDKIIDSLITD